MQLKTSGTTMPRPARKKAMDEEWVDKKETYGQYVERCERANIEPLNRIKWDHLNGDKFSFGF